MSLRVRWAFLWNKGAQSPLFSRTPPSLLTSPTSTLLLLPYLGTGVDLLLGAVLPSSLPGGGGGTPLPPTLDR